MFSRWLWGLEVKLKLTDKTVESRRATSRQVDYWDVTLPGFGLRVTPKGRKTFTVRYRINGVMHRMTLGTYPRLTLADARDRARKAFAEVEQHRDPLLARQRAQQAPTFDELQREYMERHAKPKKRSRREDQRIINAYLLPVWRTRKAHDIERRDVRAIIDNIAVHGLNGERAAPVQALHVLACARKIFNWALSATSLKETHAGESSGPAKCANVNAFCRRRKSGAFRPHWTPRRNTIHSSRRLCGSAS